MFVCSFSGAAVRNLRRSLHGFWQGARKIVAVLRDDGLVEGIVFVRSYVEYRRERLLGSRVDRKYGSETGGRIPLDRLEIDSPNLKEGVQYQPVSELYFHRMLSAVEIRPGTYAFVDLGSGKGRALLMAAEYPFTRFIGIDFSPELHDVAERNVARYKARTRSTQSFDLRVGDATSFEFPPEPIALHLFNPFGEPVLRQVLDRLDTSLRDAPREVLVFYRNPLHGRLLEEAPFLERIKATSQYAVYAGGR
jgi:SAM-dependent methyltransferase